MPGLKSRLPFVHWTVRLLTLCAIAFAIRTMIGEASVVPTPSMEGTILVGDHLLINKLAYAPQVPFTNYRLPRLKNVRRGEIVAFKFPRDPQVSYLKRVVAVGGDTVELRFGVLHVNGLPVEEPYLLIRPMKNVSLNMLPKQVPEGELFVMGDNRDNSSDSRVWGTVPEENVIGEPIVIFWSYQAPSSEWLDRNWRNKLRFYGSMFTHFSSNTRWDRTGTLL